MRALTSKPYEALDVNASGLVPMNWLPCRLKDKTTSSPSKSEIKELPEECTFAPMEKLKTDSLLTDSTTITSDMSGSYTYFREGDILVAKVTPCFENRNIAIARNLENGIGFGSSEISVIRVSKKENTRWFFYLFMSSAFIEVGASKMAGAGGLKRIPSSFLDSFSFNYPPIYEQTVIADYLDTKTAQFDKKISLLEAKASKYLEIKKSLINETVTQGLDKSSLLKDSGLEWIGAIPQHWAVKRIKEFSSVVNGATPKSNVAENWDGDLPWVTTDDLGKLNGKFITETKRRLTEVGYASCGTTICPAGSVVISGRAPIGHLGILAIEASTNQGCKTLVIDHRRVSNLFIYFSLMAAKSKLEALGRGTTFIELSTKELSLFSLTFPPLKEQQVIAAYLEKKTNQIDLIVGSINSQIEKLIELRKTLINDVVTGKMKLSAEGNLV